MPQRLHRTVNVCRREICRSHASGCSWAGRRLIARLLGRDKIAESLESLFDLTKQILQVNPAVRDLREGPLSS
jgi:hypothetical protein